MHFFTRLAIILAAWSLISCSNSSTTEDPPPDNTIKLSGVVYAPSGASFQKVSFLDSILDSVFGKRAMAVLTGASAVGADIPVKLVDTTLTGDAAIIAEGTTSSDGSYSLNLPDGFTADAKYVIRAEGINSQILESRVSALSNLDVDPVSHVASELVTQLTSNNATNLAKLLADELIAIQNEVSLLLPQTETDYSTETSLVNITSGLKAAALNNPETANVVFSATSSGEICGTITDTNNTTVAGVLVVARDFNEWVTRAKATTDSNGDYCINLPINGETVNSETHDGKYILGVISRVGETTSDYWASEWWTNGGGSANIWGAELIELTTTTSTATKDFQLALGGRIKGLINDASGLPIQGVQVLVRDYETWYPVASTRTNSEGKYRLNLQAGSYLIVARNKTRIDGATEIFSNPDGSYIGDHASVFGAGEKVVISASQDSIAKFNLQSGVLVKGTVLDDIAGNPVSGVRVRFDIDGQFGALVSALRTDKNGKYNVWLKPEVYEVHSRGQVVTGLDLSGLSTPAYTQDFSAAVAHTSTKVLHNSTGVSQALAFLWRVDNATTGDMTLVSQEVSSSDGSVDIYIEDETASHILEIKLKEGASGAASIIYADQSMDTAAFAMRRLDGTNISVAASDVPASINLPDGFELSGTVSDGGGNPLGTRRVIVRQAGVGKLNNFTADVTSSDGSYNIYLPAATYGQLFACDPTNCGGVFDAVNNVAISAVKTQDFTLP